jgi:uncharacterized protein (DUF488 family)
MPRIATIGVYHFNGESFVAALDEAGVTVLIDVRQRRGVRGPEYAWANSTRLQRRLADARIRYVHHPELAPTTEMRELQYEHDAREHVGKRDRTRLADAYAQRYIAEILDPTPLEPLLDDLPVHGLGALMCVETDAAACHRALIAQRLAERHGFEVEHLMP